MAEDHLDLVSSIAHRYRGYGLPYDDLVQEGTLGLLAAVRNYNTKRGVPFRAYAARWIRQAICRGVSIRCRIIRIPLDVLQIRRRLHQVRAQLEQESAASGRSPTVEECARVMGVTPEVLRTTLRRVPEFTSLDAPRGGKGMPLVRLPPDTRPCPFASAASRERGRLLRSAIAELPGRLGRVMRRRYGIRGHEAATLAQIGAELGVSRERARQLHNRGIMLLRQNARLRAGCGRD